MLPTRHYGGYGHRRRGQLRHLSDAQFDALVEQAINELDPVKQAELTAQAEQIFLTMRPSCPCMKTA